MRRWGSLVAAVLVLLGPQRAMLAAEDPGALIPLPEPPLERMEPAVRRQLEQARSTVDGMLASRGGSSSPEATAATAEAMGLLGRLYLGYGLSNAAEAALRNAQRLAPDGFAWAYYLGTLYQHERRVDDARVALQRALELRADDVPALLRLGEVEIAAGRGDEAQRAFASALALDAESAAAHEGLARVAAAKRDLESAATHYQAALRLQPAAAAVHYPLAMAYRDLGRTEAMREELAKVGEGKVRFADPLAEEVQRSVTGVGPHLAIGHIALRAGDLEQATERFQAALEADPESPPAHHAMAMVLERRGETAEALAELDRAAELAPRDAELLRAAAAAHLRAKDDFGAIELLRAAAEVAPDARTSLDLAMALERTGNLKEAAERYGAVAQARPDDALPLIRRALVFQRMGKTAEAASELEAVLLIEPRNAEALLRLAQLRVSRGETALAIDRYRALLALDLGAEVDAGVHVALGDLLEASDPAGAAEHYGTAARLLPQQVDLRLREARALLLAGRDLDARRSLEAASKDHGDDTELTHLLARVLAASEVDAVRDGARSLELAQAAFAARRDVDRAETVAMALAELGRFPDAVAWQRRIVEQIEAAGGAAPEPALLRRLRAYEQGLPCRAPWRDAAAGEGGR